MTTVKASHYMMYTKRLPQFSFRVVATVWVTKLQRNMWKHKPDILPLNKTCNLHWPMRAAGERIKWVLYLFSINPLSLIKGCQLLDKLCKSGILFSEHVSDRRLHKKGLTDCPKDGNCTVSSRCYQEQCPRAFTGQKSVQSESTSPEPIPL